MKIFCRFFVICLIFFFLAGCDTLDDAIESIEDAVDDVVSSVGGSGEDDSSSTTTTTSSSSKTASSSSTDTKKDTKTEKATKKLALRYHHYNPDGKDEGMGCTLICCNKDARFDSVTLGGVEMKYHRGKEEDHVGDNRDAWVIWHKRGCTGEILAKKGSTVYAKTITKSKGFTKGPCWGELNK